MTPNDKTACCATKVHQLRNLENIEILYVNSKQIERHIAIVFLFSFDNPHKISNHKNRIQLGKDMFTN